jgi:hypothetical protein
MSTKLKGMKNKLVLSATLVLIGMAVAPYASAAQQYCTDGDCVTCYRIAWTWMCF